ncbi:S53 family peptidase [Stygiolobus caldivivus]|uniref:Peptidase S53 n=1 Tax=Stygiolobus caldivivus TaxID=2824673 RepID=A0A8D5U642_9CREN|nr:protease pro-enzyme activation domain-containing protein [Stygiolobus caldivivus]BCU69957.1 peptidase S53 [Stygiolobus caldivivus]
MNKSIKGKYLLSSLILVLLVMPVFTTVNMLSTADSGTTMYYIYNNSPQYSVLPGSIYVQQLPSNYEIPFAVLLNFTNYQTLLSITNEISNHEAKYLSPSQFRSEFYPSQSYKESLIKYLESYGISFTGDYGLILTFQGTVGEIEKAFHTYINCYYYPNQNLDWFGLLGIENIGPFYYFTNNVTPSLPYKVGKYIVGIVGIDSVDPKVYPVIRSAWTLEMHTIKSSDPSLVSSVLVTPKAIAQYFGFTELYSQGYLGQGTKIAIEGVPESYVETSDIYQFWKEFDIVPRTGGLHVVYLGYYTISGQSSENELDAEWSGVFAPASDVYIVFSNGYVGGPALVGNSLNYYYEYYYMVNYIDPNVISISVTLPESFLAAYYPAMLWMIHNIMMQAVDEGISVLAASGDWGFESDNPPPNFNIGIFNTIWYPESDPYVSAVGGIFVNATSTGQVQSISGWDYSTGGISVVFPVQNFELTSLIPFTPFFQRTYPDIAFVSAGGYNIVEYGFGLPLIFDGQLYVWYGTSGAAPMTAAMVALTGLKLGDLNTILYHISYLGFIITPKGFAIGMPAWIPITSGNNPLPAYYGWNFVTGPGTYNAYGMVYDLRLFYSVVY